jgi:uracil-DNA glycosylase
MPLRFAEMLVDTLPVGQRNLFNPWREHCPHDAPDNGPEARLLRLAWHLDCNPRVILVGEAPGYQGCRYSGVAFTSERLLMEGTIPRIKAVGHRLSTRPRPFSEPSATIVWKALYQIGLAEQTILWNAVQLHPSKPEKLWSNRSPTDAELEFGAPALRILRDHFDTSLFVAVGKKAGKLMTVMGIPPAETIRHPANGGAKDFTYELAAAAAKL